MSNYYYNDKRLKKIVVDFLKDINIIHICSCHYFVRQSIHFIVVGAISLCTATMTAVNHFFSESLCSESTHNTKSASNETIKVIFPEKLCITF